MQSNCTLVALTAIALASATKAQSFSAICNGASVVPGTSSTRRAFVSAELRSTPEGPQLDYAIRLEGLDLTAIRPPTRSTRHGGAHPPRSPATTVRTDSTCSASLPWTTTSSLADPVAGTLVGTWDDTDENFIAPNPPASTVRLSDSMLDLLSCGLYVQIHTSSVNTGEIRGQLMPQFQFDLSGDQVVPAGGGSNAASGRATVTLLATATGPELAYELELDGLDLDGNQTPLDPFDDVTGIHVQLGAAGSNGAHALNVFGAPSLDDAQMTFDAPAGRVQGVWDDSDEAVNPAAPLNQSTITVTAASAGLPVNALYVEVDTVGFPSGVRSAVKTEATRPYSESLMAAMASSRPRTG